MSSDMEEVSIMLEYCEDFKSCAYMVKLFGDFREAGIDVAEACTLVLEDMYGTE